jgi:class 3 adenylate cyclase
MQQIADWLKTLGMSEYAQRFAENRIDLSVLPELTDQHLKDLGIALGDRLKMLRAIRELSNAAAPTPEPPPAQPKPQDAAERRQVTVMFSDLVGSTALSARMDPEDLREVISSYQKCVAETVQRFGGFVAKYMGDGVLVYFGYPRAHEDDAERAVRAGLDLVAAVGALKTHAPLQTRIGIATGLVVVGDLIGSGASQEQAIVGETPNLAARLQGVAEPNRVVIADNTRKLLGNLFELEDLGAQNLKGIKGAERAWVAVRPSSAESRFEAFHASGVSELVGRDEELELLLRRWSKAKTGEGQVVLLSGEAGIGKSRLIAALLENLASEPHTRLRNFCSPQYTDSSLYPTIVQIERAAGFTRDDTPQSKLDKLDALLAQSSTSTHDAALFADMLSVSNDGRYAVLDLTPQERRKRTLEALVSQVAALSNQNPLLMIFEDAHWTDPTSLELFGRIVDKIRTLRALLIVTFRPEFDPPWIGRPYVMTLTLNRLAEREISAMIDRVVGNKLLPTHNRQDIIERTDGIPLFIEEMTKAVLEAGGEEAAQQALSVIPSPSLTVPASLHASLMARLDRLGPAKEVAQIGAAIGREFSHALLAAIARKPEAELQSALDRLVRTGLLFQQGMPPNASYLFKHALVQDAAYGTLLREPRRALHARVANTLESQFTDIAENQPGMLARQCTEAGLIEKAVGWWGKAGQRSLARSALVEGAEQLSRALLRSRRCRPRPRCVAKRSASSRTHTCTPSCQRICSARNQGGCGASTSTDRASQSSRRATRRSAAAVLDPLRRLDRELHCVQRRHLSQCCGAGPNACRETRNDRSADARASHHWRDLGVYGRLHGKSSAPGSRTFPPRPHRASCTGNAVWPRPWGNDLELSVVGLVVSWISRRRADGCRASAPRRARNRPSCHVNVCARRHGLDPYVVQKSCSSEFARG